MNEKDKQEYLEGYKKAKEKGKDKEETKPVEIDLENTESRAFRMPIKRGRFSYLAVNDKNHLIYLRRGEESVLQYFDPNDEKREEKTIIKKALKEIRLSHENKKLIDQLQRTNRDLEKYKKSLEEQTRELELAIDKAELMRQQATAANQFVGRNYGIEKLSNVYP